MSSLMVSSFSMEISPLPSFASKKMSNRIKDVVVKWVIMCEYGSKLDLDELLASFFLSLSFNLDVSILSKSDKKCVEWGRKNECESNHSYRLTFTHTCTHICDFVCSDFASEKKNSTNQLNFSQFISFDYKDIHWTFCHCRLNSMNLGWTSVG